MARHTQYGLAAISMWFTPQLTERVDDSTSHRVKVGYSH
jgi:hypothetical protein